MSHVWRGLSWAGLAEQEHSSPPRQLQVVWNLRDSSCAGQQSRLHALWMWLSVFTQCVVPNFTLSIDPTVWKSQCENVSGCSRPAAFHLTIIHGPFFYQMVWDQKKVAWLTFNVPFKILYILIRFLLHSLLFLNAVSEVLAVITFYLWIQRAE